MSAIAPSTHSLTTSSAGRAEPVVVPNALIEPLWIRLLLGSIALLFLTLFLFVPLAAVFSEALKKGWDVYFTAINEDDAWSAIKLTLITASIAVPLNLVLVRRLSIF